MVLIRTSGDRLSQGSLAPAGGKGLFVKELEEALADRRIDCAVHSMKDVPAALAPGLAIGAIPARADARDVLVGAAQVAGSRGFAPRRAHRDGQRAPACPAARASPRPRASCSCAATSTRASRSGGPGRWTRSSSPRPGWRASASASLRPARWSPTSCCPRWGRGRSPSSAAPTTPETRALLGAFADPDSTDAVAAERAFLIAIGGDCNTPLAAHARIDDGRGRTACPGERSRGAGVVRRRGGGAARRRRGARPRRSRSVCSIAAPAGCSADERARRARRCRPRRSRAAHAARAALARGRRRRRARRPRAPPPARVGAARMPRSWPSAVPHGEGDRLSQAEIERLLIDAGARGEARRPAQERRSVRLRARRRGGAGAARCRHRRSRWFPASPRPSPRRLRRHPRHPSRPRLARHHRDRPPGLPARRDRAGSSRPALGGAGSPGRHAGVPDGGAPAREACSAALVGAGLDPATPAALVHRGTLGSQRTVEGTAATLAERAHAAGVPATRRARHRRRRVPARARALVRGSPAARPPHRGDAAARAGRRAGARPGRRRGRGDPLPHHRDRSAAGPRRARARGGDRWRLRLDALHQRQRRPRLLRALRGAWWRHTRAGRGANRRHRPGDGGGAGAPPAAACGRAAGVPGRGAARGARSRGRARAPHPAAARRRCARRAPRDPGRARRARRRGHRLPGSATARCRRAGPPRGTRRGRDRRPHVHQQLDGAELRRAARSGRDRPARALPGPGRRLHRPGHRGHGATKPA